MRTDRRTDMTKIKVIFRNFARATKNWHCNRDVKYTNILRLLDSFKTADVETFTQWDEMDRAKSYFTDLIIYCKRYKFWVICNHLHHTRKTFMRIQCVTPELLACPTEIPTISRYFPYSPRLTFSAFLTAPVMHWCSSRRDLCSRGTYVVSFTNLRRLNFKL